jgi:hypothetical protein
VIEFVIATVAAATTKEIVNEAAGLTKVDFVIFVFLLPQFVIAVKRSGLGLQTKHRAGVVIVALNIAKRHHHGLLIYAIGHNGRLLSGKFAFVCGWRESSALRC